MVLNRCNHCGKEKRARLPVSEVVPMNESVYLDISGEGVVSVKGRPPGDAAHWALLARGLTGYFRATGLTGPEKAQERIAAFHALIKQYGIDPAGIESGVVQ